MGVLETYFINPILYEQGYNYINTIAYALIAFGLLFLLNALFRRTETQINPKFFLSLIPFIAMGSLLRALVDSGHMARTFWTVSPGIYFSITMLFLASFLAVYRLKTPIWRSNLAVGTVLFFLLVAFTLPYNYFNPMPAFWILLSFIILSLVVYYLLKRLKWSWATAPLATIAITTQIFDATITSYLVQFFGAVEKHPMPRMVMDYVGNAFVFIPLKLAVIFIAIYVITKDVKDKQFRNLLLLAIAILGLAQGLRNLLSFVI